MPKPLSGFPPLLLPPPDDDDSDNDFPSPPWPNFFNEPILPKRIAPPLLPDLSPPSFLERNEIVNKVLYPDKCKSYNVIGELTMERNKEIKLSERWQNLFPEADEVLKMKK